MISCSSKSFTSLWASNNFPCKNFTFDLLSRFSVNLFIWMIFMVVIDFLSDLFLFSLPIASSFFCFWSSRYLTGRLRFSLDQRLYLCVTSWLLGGSCAISWLLNVGWGISWLPYVWFWIPVGFSNDILFYSISWQQQSCKLIIML